MKTSYLEKAEMNGTNAGFATDSICTTKELGINSVKLGEFSSEGPADDMFFLQNGFYKVGGTKFRNKGFANIGNNTIENLEPFEQDGKIKYTFEITKVGTQR